MKLELDQQVESDMRFCVGYLEDFIAVFEFEVECDEDDEIENPLKLKAVDEARPDGTGKRADSYSGQFVILFNWRSQFSWQSIVVLAVLIFVLYVYVAC